MNFGGKTSNALRGGPPSGEHVLCTRQWRKPNDKWKFQDPVPVVSSKHDDVTARKPTAKYHEHTSKQQQQQAANIMALPAAVGMANKLKVPLWKRRGAKPVPTLRLHPVIRCDIDWADKVNGCDELLQIVLDSEWQTVQPNYFEVHSLNDMEDGVVIGPSTYPAWYAVPSSVTTVPALLPNGREILLKNALREGYSMETLIRAMGNAILSYTMALIHRTRRSQQEVLILARQGSWQGAAAIYAATRLLRDYHFNVSVLIVNPRDGLVRNRTKEENEFLAYGGAVYRNLLDLGGRKFRVIIVALEDQYSGRKSDLPLYGELLQHAVAILVDPPVLKCSYTTALQIATGGCYNMCQKTILLVPFLPKPYIADNFVELVVVDGGISEHTQRATGITQILFPRPGTSVLQNVIPVEYTVRGSRLYFYKNGKRVSR